MSMGARIPEMVASVPPLSAPRATRHRLPRAQEPSRRGREGGTGGKPRAANRMVALQFAPDHTPTALVHERLSSACMCAGQGPVFRKKRRVWDSNPR